ncbi:MAG: PPC domain-containing DNA-binding protein [Nanoarchaeota archaeon]
MESFLVDGGWLLVLSPGEEIMGSLKYLCREKAISNGRISGIGSLGSATIGFFDLTKKAYVPRKLDEPLELINLMGNVMLVDGDPFIHAHASLGRADYRVIGGHLVEGVVNVTGEIWIRESKSIIERKLDERTGLKLIGE